MRWLAGGPPSYLRVHLGGLPQHGRVQVQHLVRHAQQQARIPRVHRVPASHGIAAGETQHEIKASRATGRSHNVFNRSGPNGQLLREGTTKLAGPARLRHWPCPWGKAPPNRNTAVQGGHPQTVTHRTRKARRGCRAAASRPASAEQRPWRATRSSITLTTTCTRAPAAAQLTEARRERGQAEWRHLERGQQLQQTGFPGSVPEWACAARLQLYSKKMKMDGGTRSSTTAVSSQTEPQ